jgi:hypothetical protein
MKKKINNKLKTQIRHEINCPCTPINQCALISSSLELVEFAIGSERKSMDASARGMRFKL